MADRGRGMGALLGQCWDLFPRECDHPNPRRRRPANPPSAGGPKRRNQWLISIGTPASKPSESATYRLARSGTYISRSIQTANTLLRGPRFMRTARSLGATAMTDAEKLAFAEAFKQSEVRHITDPEILRLMAVAAWQRADQLEKETD